MCTRSSQQGAGEAGGAGRQGASPVCRRNDPQYTGEKQETLEGICWEQKGGESYVPPPTVGTWSRGSKIHMKVIGNHRSALSRQISEAVRIRRRGGESRILNSKAEYNRSHILD